MSWWPFKKDPDVSNLEKAHNRLMARFVYVDQTIADKGKGPWRSITHIDKVYAGQTWSGDCDDYATTACNYIASKYAAEGYIPSYMLCKTDRGVYHAVCCVNIKGTIWVIDNLRNYPEKMSKIKYTWIEPRLWTNAVRNSKNPNDIFFAPSVK